MWLAWIMACTAPLPGETLGPPGFDPTPWLGSAPQRPFPQPPSTTGHVPPGPVAGDVARAYDAWVRRYVVWAPPRADGAPRFRVKSGVVQAGDTVSEGQGYGMLATVWMAGHDPYARARFDGLWRYALDHPSTGDDRLMDWHVPPDERAEPGDDDSAFDGDADMALALLLADRQWGSGGRVDYALAAREVMDGLADAALGPVSGWPMLGDWVDPGGARYNQFTPRSSDWMPGHFAAFADATGDARWVAAGEAAHVAIQQVQADHAAGTGLLPDFLVPDGQGGLQPAPPRFLEARTDGAWSYNAVRDPWRLGEQALYASDPRAQAEVEAMSAWARAATGDDPRRLASGYSLAGAVLPGAAYNSSLFVASVMVATSADPSGQTWTDAAWRRVATAHEGYFEDSVTLLAMLTASGLAWRP